MPFLGNSSRFNGNWLVTRDSLRQYGIDSHRRRLQPPKHCWGVVALRPALESRLPAAKDPVHRDARNAMATPWSAVLMLLIPARPAPPGYVYPVSVHLFLPGQSMHGQKRSVAVGW